MIRQTKRKEIRQIEKELDWIEKHTPFKRLLRRTYALTARLQYLKGVLDKDYTPQPIKKKWWQIFKKSE